MLKTILLLLYAFNILLFIFFIILTKKRPVVAIGWFLSCLILPYITLIFFFIFGAGLNKKTCKQLKNSLDSNFKNTSVVDENFDFNDCKKYADIINLNFKNCNAKLTKGDILIFNNTISLAEDLICCLQNAKKSICLEYYIFSNDKFGQDILKILISKALQGINVKVLIDSVGSYTAYKHFFKELILAGGEVKQFLQPLLRNGISEFYINYRNHRKIVIVDDSVAYLGGVNLREDHLGKNKKLSPWRDTHIKISGQLVLQLKNVFNSDYFCDVSRKIKYRITTKAKEKIIANFNNLSSADNFNCNGNLSPSTESKNEILIQKDVHTQLIFSGPYNYNYSAIKSLYLKLINTAHKSILIQTPYFVPDVVIFESLKNAIMAGVSVKIMAPLMDSKKIAHIVTLSNLKEMAKLGATIYLYKGFIHAKTLVVDDDILCIGSCNFDNRSFNLNFEVQSIFYDEKLGENYKLVYNNDMDSCVKANFDYFNKYVKINRLATFVYKLFSPLL